MTNDAAKQETVFDAGTIQARLAHVYAEAYLASALKDSPQRAVEVGTEFKEFVHAVSESSDVAEFLNSPAIGKKAKAAALAPALKGKSSDLLRGLVGVLIQNNRLDLLRNIDAAYQKLLDERAGRVPVKVTAAIALSDDERAKLVTNLKNLLRQEPVLDVRVDPELLGGLVVQVGDSVIDTSVRSRLQSIRALLQEQ